VALEEREAAVRALKGVLGTRKGGRRNAQGAGADLRETIGRIETAIVFSSGPSKISTPGESGTGPGDSTSL